MKRNTIVQIICWLLALLFIDVGLSKLMDNYTFTRQLSVSPIVQNFVPIIAIPLPVIELAVAIAVLIPITRRYGLIAAFLLMLIFTGYTIYLLKFADHVPCSCGGIFKSMSWSMHLIVNSAMTLLLIIAIWLSNEGMGFNKKFLSNRTWTQDLSNS